MADCAGETVLYLMIYWMQLLQNTVSHVIVQSGFVTMGHDVLTEEEHGILITVVQCEINVTIMSAQFETVTIVWVVPMRWSRYICMFCL